MTSVVRQVEAAFETALNVALFGAAKVTGFRAYVEHGLVKSSDGDGRPEVLVAVTPAASENYASPVISFDVALTVRLEWSDDPTIRAFDETAAVVERMIMRWNCRANIEEMSAALTTDNFRCDGFRLGGGSDNISGDGSRSSISTVFNMTVKGVFIDDET